MHVSNMPVTPVQNFILIAWKVEGVDYTNLRTDEQTDRRTDRWTRAKPFQWGIYTDNHRNKQ